MNRRDAIKTVSGAILVASGSETEFEMPFPASTPLPDEICFASALDITGQVARKEVKVSEVVQAHLDQIEKCNPAVNAICTLDATGALNQALEAEAYLAAGGSPRPLEGIPVVVKDLVPVKGMRTTMGSPIYADAVPDEDALIVERMRNAGAIIIGKSNTPEFGAGSHTFNPVFGVTRNPYDLARVAGGSSGGGAAALTCGMVPLADGSDLGGSVRNPPNFNNVVGLRPSPGRIPRYPNQQPWNSMPVLGPMARTVADAAHFLSVLAGPDPRDPLSIHEDPSVYRSSLEMDLSGTRIAWSPDLGILPVQKEVIQTLEDQLPVLESLGCRIERAHPDFQGTPELFQTLRAAGFAAGLADDLEMHRDKMKETVIWNIEKGLALSSLDVSNAQAERAALFHRVRTFFNEYDFLLLPVSQVVPFPVETEWVQEIEGVTLPTYIDWMMSCSLITLTEHPALSLPFGFTQNGLPVGIQIVAPFRKEFDLLRFAHQIEQAHPVGKRRPALAM